jgi:hypothetical protein
VAERRSNILRGNAFLENLLLRRIRIQRRIDGVVEEIVDAIATEGRYVARMTVFGQLTVLRKTCDILGCLNAVADAGFPSQ